MRLAERILYNHGYKKKKKIHTKPDRKGRKAIRLESVPLEGKKAEEGDHLWGTSSERHR